MFWEEERKLGETKDETIESYITSNKLADLLELPYTLQELWGGNKKLIEYFCREDVLVSVVNLALRPKIDQSQPLKSHYKLPSACTEILSLRNNNDITNAFLQCDEALKVVTEFFDGDSSKDYLICGFFMRIVQHLFHRSVLRMVEVLAPSNFLVNCVASMQMAAISELLQNIVWVPQVADDFLKIKQWYVENQVCPKLVEQLDPELSECVHGNVMELFTNLIRNTRDQMYALEMKSDMLNDVLQSEELVGGLVNKMLARNKKGLLSPSVTRNASEVIISLLSSNHILYRPSHTLYKDFNAEIPWVGGNPSQDISGEVAKENAEKLFCPDSERVVERMVAARLADLVQIVIVELETDNEPEDETWSLLLRVLLELCDTNHLPTHEKIVEQFEICNFRKLFSLVWRHPRYSIFHGLLQRIVSYILYSSTQSLSPLITYLFKSMNLPEIVRYGVDPRCVLKKIDLFSLRTHHIHLVLAVEQALKTAPSAEGIQGLVQECDFWPEISMKVSDWLSWNLPDPEVASVRPSNQHDAIDEALDDFERQMVAPQQHALYEFKSQTVSVPMTDVFDTALSELQVSSETKGFAVHGLRVCKVDMDLDENDVDESDFEAMCGMKKCSLLEDWPMQEGDQSSRFATFDDEWPGVKKSNGGAVDDWPGVSETTSKGKDGAGFPVQWDQAPATSSESWSCFPQGSSTPRKAANGEDEWADFSSLKDDSVDKSGDWPGTGKDESNNWMDPAAPDAVDPVLAGFATTVVNCSLDGRFVNDSDC